LNDSREFDQRVLSILHILLAKQGNIFVPFIIQSKEAVFPLMDACTKKRDNSACILCNQLVVSHPDVQRALIPDLKPMLREFPAALTVDLMLGSIELKETMTQPEFEDWLFKQDVLTMSDVCQSCRLFTGIWEKVLVLEMFLRTTPPEKYGFVDWIHRQPPQSLEVRPQIIEDTVESLLNPKFELPIVRDDIGGKMINTRELYIFSRLYVLSFADPAFVSPAGISAVYKFLDEGFPYIAAGALQVLAIWVANFGFSPERWVIYKIAAQINGRRSEGMQQLSRVILALYAKVGKMGEHMLMTEDSLRFDPKNRMKITRETWEFPHLAAVIDTVAPFDVDCDQMRALAVLGELVTYLGLDLARILS
jgi:hypothetical protein